MAVNLDYLYMHLTFSGWVHAYPSVGISQGEGFGVTWDIIKNLQGGVHRHSLVGHETSKVQGRARLTQRSHDKTHEQGEIHLPAATYYADNLWETYYGRDFTPGTAV